MGTLKRIGFYGVSGVGKTTILKEAAAHSSELVWLEGSRLILHVAGLPLEEFKRLDELAKYDLRERAIHRALEIQNQEQRHVIIDGHMVFATGEGEFHNVMTAADADFYTDYIYLNLPASIVLKRQQHDQKHRREFSEDTIAAWMAAELKAIRNVCHHHKANLHVLQSVDNHQCVDFILNLLRAN